MDAHRRTDFISSHGGAFSDGAMEAVSGGLVPNPTIVILIGLLNPSSTSSGTLQGVGATASGTGKAGS
jgi:hypothetical protein